MIHSIIQSKKHKNIISIVVAICFWQLMSMIIGEELFLPSPISVLIKLVEMPSTREFYLTIFASSNKILTGFFIAVILGFIMAVISLKSETAAILFKPYISIAKTVPVASIVVLCLLWLNVEHLSTFIVFLVNLPIIYINSFNGLKSADGKLLELADVYDMGFLKRMRFIYIPSMREHFLAGISLASGVAWKSGVAAEVIGVPTKSIGTALYNSKIYLETPELFAWTFIILLLSAAYEKIVIALFKLIFRRLES